MLDDTSNIAQQLNREAWQMKEEIAALTTKLGELDRQTIGLNRELPAAPGEADSQTLEYSDCDWFER